ncbi:MAG TPA: phospholipase D-like domain-containing protein [Bryobacteraceae bacterium]|nr:phospholipase D-like domain-containing protein [Bryobacteraceae bacterium]
MPSSRTIVMLMLVGCLGGEVRASNYALVTEPDQGLSPIYNLISSAKSTLDMTMYELTDTQAEQLLAQAAALGVKVRVILDQNLEKNNNTTAYNYLAAHNVQVHWANPKYSATHQKTIIVDGSSAAIMTLNLTSQYYSTSRDFAVIENDPNDVAAIEATFNADFSNSAIEPPDGDDLVWSPTNSQPVILSVINSAQHSLLVENEEMGDTNVVNALVSAAGRGVLVQVVMTNSSNDYSTQFTQLVAAGVEVSTYAANAPLYIHAKVILADYGSAGAQVFIGSENFSSASLTRNRELGLTTSDPAILQSIDGALTGDFVGGTPWAGSQPGLAVVNAASSQPGFASGAWVTIFGTNLAPIEDDWTSSIVNGQLPTSLDGVTVTVGGQPAYPAFISPTQINAVAPDVGTGTLSVTVSAPGGSSTRTLAVAQAVQPAFFEWGNYAVATHQDYSYAAKNGALAETTVPAAPGEVIILWGTGFGLTTPPAPVGAEALSDVSYNTASPVNVTLGNMPVTVLGAALAPGFAALYQVAIRTPESLEDGDYPVVATVSGAQSPSGVLLTVRK